MSIESDAASQVIGIYTKGIEVGAEVAIKVGEKTFKLTGMALKALISFIARMLQQEGKSGRIKLKNMLSRAATEEKTIGVIRINSEDDFKKLEPELKAYGVTFAKAKGKNCWDILIFEDDAPRINIIFEKLGLNSVQKVGEATAEQVNDKEDPFSEEYYEQDFSLDDDAIEYENSEDLVGDYFDAERENQFAPPFEQDSEITDPYADGSYYENNLPFDESNVIDVDYENFDDFINDYSANNNETIQPGANQEHRFDTEKEDPTKARNEKAKSENQSEQKSAKAKNKDSVKKKIDNKKTERTQKAAEAPTKAVETAKAVKQGVKSK